MAATFFINGDNRDFIAQLPFDLGLTLRSHSLSRWRGCFVAVQNLDSPMLDVFLYDTPPSPPPSSASPPLLSPIAFQPPDDLFPRTPRPLPFDAESPVVRADRPGLLSPLTPLPTSPPRKRCRLAASSPPPIFSARNFPAQSPLFPLLYRRFPASSFYAPSPSSCVSSHAHTRTDRPQLPIRALQPIAPRRALQPPT
ncbi:hypothetical protein C0992_008823 [Termitomyces sp. T32_za158]|nr:hypothetical protein C0992_008823 [Termitomyces sp. T32_za158]